MPRVHRLSFRATGTPARGPGSSPAATRASMLVGRGPGLVGEHEVEGVELALALGDAAEVLLDDVGGRPLARPRTAAAMLEGARHGASPRMGGTRKRPSSTAGAAASTSSRSRQRPLDVGPQHVDQRVGLRHGLDAVEVEGVDVAEVVEHGGQLAGVALELVGGQLEAGEAGDVGDVGRRDGFGHGSPC